MNSRALLLHPRDSVAVALDDLPAGCALVVAEHSVVLREPIPRGHKFALAALEAGAAVLKFGQQIGSASAAIPAGAHVHVHNLRTHLSGAETYVYAPRLQGPAPRADGRTFEGFLRSDGEVGIRNEVWILPTVGCVNEVAQALARRARERGLPPGVDGVHAFVHPHGCSQLGDDYAATQRVLAGLARHPNAAGVLVIGLGCENNTMASFRAVLGPVDPARYRFLVAQDCPDEMAAGQVQLDALLAHASVARRTSVPVARLRVGLKCGGSDGLSGITANPLVGAVSDLLVARGGASVLTEVPEMFGAEALFLNRCADRSVFDACVAMIDGFKAYFQRHGQPIYENPSPGNREGGLTTLEEKSLGCLQKGGTATVADVLPYGGRLRRSGLSFLEGPGNDIVSLTALAAAGVHLVLFTTGRGTPLGGPVPTLKIASNSELAARKPGWIDFDAGRLVSEGAPLQGLADALFAQLLDVASGRRLARNETNGFREIALFKNGVTL